MLKNYSVPELVTQANQVKALPEERAPAWDPNS